MNPSSTWTTPVKRGATTRVSLLQIRKDASGFNVNLCSRVTRCRFHTCKRMSYVPPVFCNKNMLSSAGGCCWPPSWLSVGARRRLCNCPSEVEVWQPGPWLRWTLSTLLSESETWKLERIVKTNCDLSSTTLAIIITIIIIINHLGLVILTRRSVTMPWLPGSSSSKVNTHTFWLVVPPT